MALAPNATQSQRNAHYRSVMRSYLDAINQSDVEGMVRLFADDAEVWDPVGAPELIRGIKQIRDFCNVVAENKVRLQLAGHIVGSKSNVVLMPHTATVSGMEVHGIVAAYFNELGLIRQWHSHWGPGDYPEGVDDPIDSMKP